MLPIVAFTGFSNSGKTTVVSGVVKALAKRGYKAGVIKHDGHGHKLALDEGADSVVHKNAGAVCSIVSSANGYMLLADSSRDSSPQELAVMMPAGTDIIICEGFKNADIPKIEVFREREGARRVNEGDVNLIATASDKPVDGSPHNLDINNHEEIADFVEEKFLKSRQDIALYLTVDGMPVPTKDFILQMLTYSIHGLIKPLKGCDNPKEIIIKAVYD